MNPRPSVECELTCNERKYALAPMTFDEMIRRFWFWMLAVSVVIALTIARASRAEAPSLSPIQLHAAPIQIEVTVLTVEFKALSSSITNIWHRVRIDRVIAGDGMKVGDETAVVSETRENPPGTLGSSGQRGAFRGVNGLPIRGDRARLFASGSPAILKPLFPSGWQPLLPSVDFIAADDEYRSEITLPFLAGLVAQIGLATTHLHFAADPIDASTADVKSKTAITDAGRIKGRADAIVLFMRFAQLRDEDLAHVLAPTLGGLPLVAFRTSTHAFQYPEGSPNAKWNSQYGERFLGTPWRFHHGHRSRTRIVPPTAEAAAHPILRGVSIPADGLIVPSWLYQVEPLPADCRVLLWGEAIDSESPGATQRQPIVWVREIARDAKPALPQQRIAVTTLGHPGDFSLAEVRVITAQMIAWSIGREDSIGDAQRAVLRNTAFDAPSTR